MIKFATVGAGWIVDMFLDAAKDVGPEFVHAAVYSFRQEEGEAFAKKHGDAACAGAQLRGGLPCAPRFRGRSGDLSRARGRRNHGLRPEIPLNRQKTNF